MAVLRCLQHFPGHGRHEWVATPADGRHCSVPGCCQQPLALLTNRESREYSHRGRRTFMAGIGATVSVSSEPQEREQFLLDLRKARCSRFRIAGLPTRFLNHLPMTIEVVDTQWMAIDLLDVWVEDKLSFIAFLQSARGKGFFGSPVASTSEQLGPVIRSAS